MASCCSFIFIAFFSFLPVPKSHQNKIISFLFICLLHSFRLTSFIWRYFVYRLPIFTFFLIYLFRFFHSFIHSFLLYVIVLSVSTCFLSYVFFRLLSFFCTSFLISSSLLQAENLGYNPLYLMIPTAVSTSFAFMLPVATPPNAIAFSYGRLKVIDMVSERICVIYHSYILTIDYCQKSAC